MRPVSIELSIDMSRPGDRVAAAGQRLLEHWERLDAPIVASLQPGLTEAEISERLTQIGVELPAEARALFAWRNGTTHAASAVPHGRAIGIADWAFWSLDDLVAWYATDWNEWRWQAAQAVGRSSAAEVWPRWFPVFRSTSWDSHIMIDCGPPGSSYPRPVAYASADAIESDALKAFSLLALLETWVLWFDAGLLTWNQAEGRWEHDEDALDWTTYRAGFF